MKNIFAKTVAVLTTAMMTVSVGAMNFSSLAITNAAENALEFTDYTLADDYSIFRWDYDGTSVSVSITNTSGSSRYAGVHVYGYDNNGHMVGSVGNSGVIANQDTLSASGNIPGATSLEFGAYLNADSSSYSPSVSNWIESAKV